ncbi:prolipoprotein diacylglyceryl transferase [Anaerofustis stercorihominis]|uniref:prolipoprotein diacylglyceryl transferase n=1 Tax=Anaerofustis stercorihominis TaxID=214853 RepID=UPI0026719895|nr:prolipoprotein diacylglyceryl transferase [Anaerofustis stercorihominis]
MLMTPNPIAFTIGSIEVRWYAICILTGILRALFFIAKRLKKLGIDPDILYDFIIVCLPLGIICARLYYVAFEWEYYSEHLNMIYRTWNGGLAIHGGLIGAFLGVYLVCRHHKLDFLKMLDVAAPCILLAQAVGRWGNYFNMEAHGSITNVPWAINVIDPTLGSIMVHPTFLYESIWDLIGFFLLYFIIDKKFKKFDGELICSYFIYYSIGRFFIEGLRTDSLMFLGLRIAQFVSLGLILAGIIGIYVIRKKHKIKDKDNDILENLKSENNRIEDIDNNEENIIKDNIDIKN